MRAKEGPNDPVNVDYVSGNRRNEFTFIISLTSSELLCYLLVRGALCSPSLIRLEHAAMCWVPTRSGDGSLSFRLFVSRPGLFRKRVRNQSNTCSSSSNSSMCLWNLLIENRSSVCEFRLFWIRSPQCLCQRETTTTTKQWRRWSAEALSYWPDMQLSSSCSSYQVGRRRKRNIVHHSIPPPLLFLYSYLFETIKLITLKLNEPIGFSDWFTDISLSTTHQKGEILAPNLH